jgi:hypothetical protein
MEEASSSVSPCGYSDAAANLKCHGYWPSPAAPPARGTIGPTPQSNWHHIPGSVIQGR